MKEIRFLYLSIFALFFLFVTILAHTKLIPIEIKSIPYYDSIGHFILFGIYAGLAYIAFGKKKVLFLPLGPVLVTLYAIIDELLQKLSPNRSYDLNDLFWGICGIITSTLIVYFLKKK